MNFQDLFNKKDNLRHIFPRISLRARVALGVALPIFLVLIFLSYFSYLREFELLEHQARLDAVQLGDMMIHSLNHAMLINEGEHLISSLADVSQLETVKSIQVIGTSGKILADSRGWKTTKIFDLGDVECQLCHNLPNIERPRVVPLEQDSRGWRISAPVENLPQCHECHDGSMKHLGVLLMDISLAGKQAQLLGDLRLSLLISVISTFLVSLMSYLLIHRLVVRRVEAFRLPLDEYTNGDFTARIAMTSGINDELGELAETFNQMADELKRHAIEEDQRQQLRELAIVEERERIGRELHDGFAQMLGYVNAKVMAVRLLVQKQKLKEADVLLEHLEQTAKGLFVDVREAILGLRMAGRFHSGLKEALKEYITEFSHLSAIKTRFECTANLSNGIVTPDVEQHIFRIVQESLNNCRKHSKANLVRLNIHQQATDLIIEIIDNGVGFDMDKVAKMEPARLGLSNMRERADELGAILIIDTYPGEGTGIKVTIPKCYEEKVT